MGTTLSLGENIAQIVTVWSRSTQTTSTATYC